MSQTIDVPYKPHPGQREVHDSPARFRVPACGARWGKDRCTVNELEAWEMALRPRLAILERLHQEEATAEVRYRARKGPGLRWPHAVDLLAAPRPKQASPIPETGRSRRPTSRCPGPGHQVQGA